MNTVSPREFLTPLDARVLEAKTPSSDYIDIPASEPLQLDCEQLLAPFRIAYKTYGELNAAKSNAILVCHALTGDQYAASPHPVTGQARLVGDDGRPRQADRHQPLLRHLPQRARRLPGLDRPRQHQPRTGKPWGLDFPVITIGDMVDAQVPLIDHLGIDQLFSVIGGSMGGMQVLEWAARHGDRVFTAVPIATAAWHSSQNIAFHEVGRQAIMADPDWRQGRYLEPARSRATASPSRAWPRTSPTCRRRRCSASSAASCRTARPRPSASTPTSRSRAICATRARPSSTGSTPTAISTSPGRWTISTWRPSMATCWPTRSRARKTRFCVVSFTSDWLYPTRESREIVQALNAVAANVSFVEIESDKGHDAFLLEEPEFFATVRGFLNAAAEKRGIEARPGGA